jgi:hypothetical protein
MRHRRRDHDHRSALALAAILGAAFLYACSSDAHPGVLGSRLFPTGDVVETHEMQ